jgi:hypothetical protein
MGDDVSQSEFGECFRLVHNDIQEKFINVCVADYFLKSTCDVNLLSKLSIIFKEWRVIVLFVLLRSHKGQTI